MDPKRSLDVPPASELCWFCSARPRVDFQAVVVEMYFVLVRDLDGRCIDGAYETRLMTVPRCGSCADRQELVQGFRLFLSLLLGVLVAGLYCRRFGGDPSSNPAPRGFLLGGCVAGAVYLLFARVIRPTGIWSREDVLRHPDIQGLLASGWQLGPRPAGPHDNTSI